MHLRWERQYLYTISWQYRTCGEKIQSLLTFLHYPSFARDQFGTEFKMWYARRSTIYKEFGWRKRESGIILILFLEGKIFFSTVKEKNKFDWSLLKPQNFAGRIIRDDDLRHESVTARWNGHAKLLRAGRVKQNIIKYNIAKNVAEFRQVYKNLAKFEEFTSF